MKYCTSCGSELIADAKFCTSCGEPVKRLEGASAQNSSTTDSAEEMKEKVVAAVSNVKQRFKKVGILIISKRQPKDHQAESLRRGIMVGFI